VSRIIKTFLKMKSIEDFKSNELLKEQIKTIYGGDEYTYLDAAGDVAVDVLTAAVKYLTVPGWFLIE